MAIYECGDTDNYIYDDGSEEYHPASPISLIGADETPVNLPPYHDPLDSNGDTTMTVYTDAPSSMMAADPGQFYFDLTEASWQQRKEDTLNAAEKAYKEDNDVEAYKKRVSEFAFPNANTSSRIKNFLNKIEEDNKKVELLREEVHTIDKPTKIPKRPIRITDAGVLDIVQNNSIVEKAVSVVVEKINKKILKDDNNQPSLLKVLDNFLAKIQETYDKISDISDKEILESTLPTKRNAEKATLYRTDGRDHQADSRSRKSNSKERDRINTTFSLFSDSRKNPIRDSSRDRNNFDMSRDYSPQSKYKPIFSSDKPRNTNRGTSMDDRSDNQSQKSRYDINLSRRGKPKLPQKSIISKEQELAERKKKLQEEEIRLERIKIEKERKALKAEKALYEKEKELEAKEKSLSLNNSNMNYNQNLQGFLYSSNNVDPQWNNQPTRSVVHGIKS